MGKVYKNQTNLTLTITGSTNISGATVKLKYKKPNGVSGEFTSGISITDAANGVIEFTPQSASDFDVVGKWILWQYVTFPDTTVAAGEPFELIISKEGT